MLPDLAFAPLPPYFFIFPLILLLLFIWQRQRIPTWFFCIPFILFIWLLGPTLRTSREEKIRAIRLDTSQSFYLVKKEELDKVLLFLKEKLGSLPVVDFMGKKITKETEISYTSFHEPPLFRDEILISDQYAKASWRAIRVRSSKPQKAILSLDIPPVCLRRELCQLVVHTFTQEPTELMLFVNNKKILSKKISSQEKNHVLSFFIASDFPLGPSFAKLILSGENTPFSYYPFLISVREGRLRGALVLDAPSLAGWQLARRLRHFDFLEIETIRLEKFQDKDYRFYIDLTGKLTKKSQSLLNLHSFFTRQGYQEKEDLFAENKELDQILEKFVQSLGGHEQSLEGMPLSVELPVCSKNKLEISSGEQILNFEKRHEKFCYYFPERGLYTLKAERQLNIEVGISLKERASLANFQNPTEDLEAFLEEIKRQKREMWIQFSLAKKEESWESIFAIIFFFGILFISWYIRH